VRVYAKSLPAGDPSKPEPNRSSVSQVRRIRIVVLWLCQKRYEQALVLAKRVPT
jgi:hypothetical protein